MLDRRLGALDGGLAHTRDIVVEGGRIRISDALEQADTMASALHGSSEQTAEELPGDVKLGRFSLLRPLGRGGMGVVYTAYDELLDRVVAIKRVRGDRGDVHLLGRVLREAKALAKLSHPNVVQIFDVGESEGQVFIAMEYVQGPTLRAWVAERRRAGAGARELLDMFLQAGRGLAAAHAAGLVHRDFKPDNVLVGPDGRARVLDFGLVTARGAADPRPPLDGPAPAPAAPAVLSLSDSGPPEPPLTRVGAIVGTPAYMSPEQWLGRQADARSDQFGFCAALHEALSGANPFPSTSLHARQTAILRGELQVGADALPVPPHVAAALRRGLSFRPEDRFPDLAALLAVLAGDPAAVRRRRLRVAALLVFTGLVVAALVLALQGLRQRWRAEQREADAAQALAGVEARIAEAQAAGDRATAERMLVGFLEDPVHKDTRSIARAWLGEAARRRDDGDSAAALSAFARAFVAARHPDDGSAALRGLAAQFRARLEWDSLGQVLALLDRRYPDLAGAPELTALRADVALARRDYDGARALLDRRAPAGAQGLVAALARARSTPYRHTRFVYGRVGDELWLLEHHQAAPVLHAARADASLAPRWSHTFPPATRVDLVDPQGPHLVAWEDTLVVYGREGDGLAPVHRLPDDQIYASAAADLDGDGRRELYVGTGTSCQITEVARDGAGAWTHRVVYDAADSTESATHSLLAIDLDRDGRQELVAALGGWRAYDVRVLRKHPTTGRLVTVARDKLGSSFGLGGLRGPGGEPLVVAEVFHREPNSLVFPPDRPFGADPGTYLLALDRGRLVRRARVPFAHDGPGATADGPHQLPLVGDADGDGRGDFANLFTDGDQLHSVVQLQGEGGGFAPVILHGVAVLGFAQLDDDPADELLVNETDARGVPSLWALGVGDERLPVRDPDVPEDISSRAPIDDPSLRRGLAGADDLRTLGLFADAADAYQELARLAPPGPQRSGVLTDAAALRERRGEDAAALALYREAADLAPGTAALRGVYRSHLRLGDYVDALAALEQLRRRPDLTADENAALIAEHERLAGVADDAAELDLSFERPLAAPWTIADPLALRRLPLTDALQVGTAAPGLLAELPLEWDGEVLDLTVDLTVDHTEWSSALTIEIAPEDAPDRPALQLLVATHGTSRGGQPALRQYLCVLGRWTHYLNRPPELLPTSTAQRSRARLRAFTIGPLGEMGCGLTDLDGQGHRTDREPMSGPLGPPGRYTLSVRARADVPAWLSVQVDRIAVRGARLRDRPPADEARAALHGALVEGDVVAALAALDRVAAADPRDRVWRAYLLTRLGRLAEAEPLWRAALADDDPAARGALHSLLRGRHAEVGSVLRATSEPRYLDALAAAWRNTGVNHLDDPRVGPELLALLQTLPAERLAAATAEPEVLRAADLLTWRASLHARAGQRAAARDDFSRALELCRRAGPTAALRAGLLRLDLASLAVRSGEPELARGHLRAAREVAPMPQLVEDIIQARAELAGLAP